MRGSQIGEVADPEAAPVKPVWDPRRRARRRAAVPPSAARSTAPFYVMPPGRALLGAGPAKPTQNDQIRLNNADPKPLNYLLSRPRFAYYLLDNKLQSFSAELRWLDWPWFSAGPERSHWQTRRCQSV